MADETETKAPENADNPAGAGPADNSKGDAKAPNADSRAPNWSGDFDPDRAARLVANLRTELADAKKLISEKEDAEKTENQRLADRAEKAEKALADAQAAANRAKIAAKHGLDEDLADLLTGDVEAMEDRAAKLSTRFGRKPADDLPTRPKPGLTPGHSGDAADKAFDANETARQARM